MQLVFRDVHVHTCVYRIAGEFDGEVPWEDQTAKYFARQIFRLYGIYMYVPV